MKKYVSIIKKLFFILAFFYILFLSNKVQAKSYTVENMDIQAIVQKDGSVEVSQTITYNFNGEYNGIFIDIPYKLEDEEYDKHRNQSSGLNDSLYNNDGVDIIGVTQILKDKTIEYKKVNNASNGSARIYQVIPNDGIYRIKVYSPSTNQLKTFNIKYTLKNLCVKHLDIGELYYNFIGGGWETIIKQLNIDVHLPNNNTNNNLYVYAHGPYNGKSTIISNNKINFKVENVKPKQYVSARVIFDLENIADSVKESRKIALGLIKADENNIIENREEKNRFTIKVIVFAGALLIYWFILIIIYEKDKKYKVAEINEEELFEKYNPLLAGCIER